MPTTKSRVIIRRIIVLSLLLFLGLATQHNLQWTKAESDATNDGLPTLRGEAALTHLKEQGLYASLGEAAKASRHSAQLLPPGIAPLLAQDAQLTANDGSAEDYFAAAVAISGDTAIVGAPRSDIGADADQGTAYIFVRSGGNWTQQAKLKTKTDTAGDFFGGSVAISGDTVIVGAYLDDSVTNVNQGAAYVFTRSAGLWLQQDKLKVDDGGANDFFGFCVAIEGDTALIGAHLNDTGVNTNQGAAYVFTRSDGAWSQTQKLAASDAAAGDLFGFSVALDAETAVIGASGKDKNGATGAGSAYVFTLSGGTWTPQQKLLPDISAADNFFGAAVAVSGDTALIGSFGDDIGASVDQGSAVVFVRSGSTWTKQQKLTTTDGAAGDMFGLSVALYADTAVIGAIGDDLGGEDQGSAYVFSRTGLAWSQQPRLIDTLGETNDKFGAPVAISGDTLLIGASFDDVGANANQGSAHVFLICQDLAERQKLTANLGAVGDEFGVSVAISGDTAVIGAHHNNLGGNTDQGSAYVFVRRGATWTQQQRLTAADGAAGADFGIAVAISGNTAVVGASYDDPGGNFDQGSAYVFVRSGSTWTQQQKITASDGATFDNFADSVAISGDTVVVGAYLHDIGGNTNQGAAYVFVRNGSTWTQQQKITASDGAAFDYFGIAVAISGDTVVVGAHYHDIGGNIDQGAAYVFARSGATWTQQQKLTASDGAGRESFAISVAISGATAVVGAFSRNIGGNAALGAAYVFVRSGATWIQQQKLTASDGNSFFSFIGRSVAISGDIVVVGMGGAEESAYVFARSGETWTERQKLTASDGSLDDLFGDSVAVSGNTVVVGAYADDIGANYNQGSAYVFACAACQSITLDPVTLPNGTAGSPYNESVTASGAAGPYNYSVSSGGLPPGLTLDSTTGRLSGTPAMVGTFNFTITATGSSLCPGRRDYSLVIDCRTINVTPANPNLPPGEVGASYNRGFTANGGLAPYSFSISAGALPAGLTLNGATGILSGAPTASGTFNFAIRATDNGGCFGSTAYVLTVNCPTINVEPANSNLPNGAVGTAYNQTFSTRGGGEVISSDVVAGAPPGGLTLNAATGVLSGVPTARGIYNFVIRATDNNGCVGQRQYQIIVN